MKKLITAIAILISLTTHAQSQKEDSLLRVEAGKYVDTLIKKTSIKEFQEFMWSNLTGKVYSELPFPQAYDLFIQSKINTWMENRKKAKK